MNVAAIGSIVSRMLRPRQEQAARERDIAERFARRFEDAPIRRLWRPRTQRRVEKVWPRIGRLKARSRSVARHYEVGLDTHETGERATAMRFTRRKRMM